MLMLMWIQWMSIGSSGIRIRISARHQHQHRHRHRRIGVGIGISIRIISIIIRISIASSYVVWSHHRQHRSTIIIVFKTT